MFIFTLITKSINYYNIGDTIFTDTGDVVGKIICRSILEKSDNEFYCSYDVDSSEDMYKKIECGDIRVSGFSSYKATSCSMSYFNKNTD